ncbi:MAG TPA: YggS family pyridoxal phosphate-dependent enzyme [Bacteroidales bacterium]|nr:YggS family pyridoxal phosphate-dependent enzyme [Bacteroidales bacterium]
MSIQENLSALLKELPPNVRLVAVSKTRPVEEILEAYRAGQRLFGENRAQEMKEKHPQLPSDIRWHFIGHLQTNKVKYIADFVDTIESIDTPRLLDEVNREALRRHRVIRCLIQFHIAREETKSGFLPEEARDFLASDGFRELRNIRIAGVMGMASLTCDRQAIRDEFSALRGYFRELRETFFAGDQDFSEISMGMSGDYRIAIEEGSTLVRIGTAIFGERDGK